MNSMPRSTPDAHICLVQPWGEPATLDTLDVALALRHDLQALGLTVSLARQRLCAEAINFVVGVQYGFDLDAARGHRCVLVNTTPLKPGGLNMPPAALRQLQRLPVINTQAGSEAVLRPQGQAEPPLVAWLPGLAASLGQALDQRPVGLLLGQTPTPRQAAVLSGMQRMGLTVTRLMRPMAGPERERLWSQCRAVLLLLTDDDAPVDALQMSLALRQGTAVLAERPHQGSPVLPAEYAEGVLWFDPTPSALRAAVDGLDVLGLEFAGKALDALAQYRRLASSGQAAQAAWAMAQSVQPIAGGLPTTPGDRMRLLGAHEARWPGWWHVRPQAQGDASDVDELLDLSAPLPSNWQERQGQLRIIDLGPWRSSRPDHAAALGACVHLLAEGGRVVLRWLVPTGHPEPQEALAQALAPWTEAFWGSGAFEHRLAVAHVGWLASDGHPVTGDKLQRAHTARVVLCKQVTSDLERQRARSVRGDFGLADRVG